MVILKLLQRVETDPAFAGQLRLAGKEEVAMLIETPKDWKDRHFVFDNFCPLDGDFSEARASEINSEQKLYVFDLNLGARSGSGHWTIQCRRPRGSGITAAVWVTE